MTRRYSQEITLFIFLVLISSAIHCNYIRDSTLKQSEELLRSDMPLEAANLLEKILESDERNAKARVLLGEAYDKLGRFQDAALQLKNAKHLYTDQPEAGAAARLKLATIYMKLGNRQDARDELRAVVHITSNEALLREVAGIVGDMYRIVQLTEGDADNYSPIFSPDGTRIAFSSFRLDNGEIYVMDLKGRIHQRVTFTPEFNETSPAFLSHSNYLFYSFEPKTSREVKIVLQSSGSTPIYSGFKVTHIHSKETRNILPIGFGVRAPRVARDGRRIVYESNSDANLELYVLEIGGLGLRDNEHQSIQPKRITNNEVDDGSPCFFPDGKRIVFVSTRDKIHQLYTVTINAGAEVRLNPNQYDCYSPIVSLDGKLIAFVSARDGDIEIYMMNADGSNEQRLTNGVGVSMQPAFSPDGRKLAFISDRSDNFQIYLMDLDQTINRNELAQRLQ
ncbi:MAG: tetratricopeptide repeat protein [Candidatus Poribacteria bacterium]|nr:tetratricopeptide repeat protein [Candidatus Poribacteria bacterium]MDE0503901.1 tetratricopeptide repeat protein [Candidatus Poribacteria bacterium]